ncbi:MAG: hypothetical protein FWH15_02990 [Betaproteobacteria bacterium]|nr:hypothetical protein [Betaproteobacteria bacterium]
MKKTILISSIVISASLLQGCSELITLVDNCPIPSKDQAQDEFLLLQDGITLKCQIKKYTLTPCIDIRDSEGTEGLVCRDGERQVLLLFDDKGILKGQATVK